MNWYKHARVLDIDPEQDWDQANDALGVFQKSQIHVDRSKDIRQVAIENGNVIGGLASGWSKGDEYEGKDVWVYSFDLAVDPQHRRKGVGLALIKQAIRTFESERHMYEENGSLTMMRVWVVNPVLVPVLENLGFSIESDHGAGGCHLIKY